MSLIKLSNVSKFYRNKNTISTGFTKLNVEFNNGEFVVITGESGSGKSTLLNVISGLDSYEEGEMYINGVETSHYTEVDYENYRRKYIGNIFQSFNLVNSYTVYQNVELVLLLNGDDKKAIEQKVNAMLSIVGLKKFKNTKVSKLSGGQKQRVAIARALAKDTPIIVADEPTGNLDVKSAKGIMNLLHKISYERLVIIVTHNYEQVEEYATRKISMHDGKIIEDKRLKDYENEEIKPYRYKDMKFLDKIKLGIRNAFNIKTKFLLLLVVYLFLTLAIFSEYSSLRKIDYDNSEFGENYYFSDISANRVILNKKNRESFSIEDIEEIKKLDNIASLVENDFLLDVNVNLFSNNVYINGTLDNVNKISKVDLGRVPNNRNEVVLKINRDSYIYSLYGDILLSEKFDLRDDNTGYTISEKFKIVGIIYDNSSDLTDNTKIYAKDEVLSDISRALNVSSSDTKLNVNNHGIVSAAGEDKFSIRPSNKVKQGNVYIYPELNYYCKNDSCKYQNINLEIKNIYYKENVNLKVTESVDKSNIKRLLGIDKIDNYEATIFISEEDFNKLYLKDSYQVSIYLKDTKSADSTLKILNNMGFETFYMKNTIVNYFNRFRGVTKVLQQFVYLVALIVLFFISYFIIKIILKSRNKYFSTVRILGATRKVAKELLNIELFVDANVAYIIFMLLIFLVKNGTINNAYLLDLTTFFSVVDYVIVYITLVVTSLLISNRYSYKLFKKSAMYTYREEV